MNIQEIIFVPTKKYVYFDEYGEITAISNTNTQGGNYIEVENSEVIGILNGTEKINLYCVSYDTVYKKYILKNRFIDENSFVSILDNIYEITNFKDDNYDLKIIKNNKDHNWEFELHSAIKENINEKNVDNVGVLNYSITRKNDPHELFQFIQVSFKELVDQTVVKIPFDSQKIVDNDNISVYTMKKFQKYYYEAVDD